MPYRPSADELARSCIAHAWRDDIDDRSRWLLERASRELGRLARNNVRLAKSLETLEAVFADKGETK